MKILGYISKVLSFYFMLIIILFIYNLFLEELPNDVIDSDEKLGYRIGQIVVVVLVIFLIYKLFKFSNKLISKSKRKNKIATIGEE